MSLLRATLGGMRADLKSGAVALLALAVVLESPAGVADEVGERCVAPRSSLPVSVVEAVDGDQLRLADGRLVRLAAVEAPKAAPGADGDVVRVAARARERLGALAVGRAVAIVPRGEDRYGRVRARVYGDGSQWLQAVLVAEGLARVRPDPAEDGCVEPLLAEESAARQAVLGLWALPDYAVRQAGDASLSRRAGLYELVEGRVLSVGHGSRMTFLDFGHDFRRDFTIMIPAAAEARFAAAGISSESLRGRRVLVRGFVEESGGPAIRVSGPWELEVLDGHESD